MSLLRRMTISFRAARTPALFPSAKPRFSLKSQHAHFRKAFGKILKRTVGASVVDHHHFMGTAIDLHCVEDGGESFRQKLFPVPVENDDGCQSGYGRAVGRQSPPSEAGQRSDKIKNEQNQSHDQQAMEGAAVL